jgi:D-alanine-D-alanine ligase-like ATP-grasp enzyme
VNRYGQWLLVAWRDLKLLKVTMKRIVSFRDRRRNLPVAPAALFTALVGVSLVAAGPAVGANRVAARNSGGWAAAKTVPGMAKLNKGGGSRVRSVSCPSAGNCGAGGNYKDSSGHVQVFVVDESHGKWSKAEEVPGTASLNKAGSAGFNSVSCGSTGHCSAGGVYESSANVYQAFVVNENGGKWGRAKEVPGTAALNAAGNAAVNSVSCSSAGNCSAGGFYEASLNDFPAFVVNETHGRWADAKQLPGIAALNVDGDAAVTAISCPSAGACSAGGYYADSSGHIQAFVVSETGGKWGRAKQVPAIGALNAGGKAEVNSVSCGAAGDCSAVGFYYANSATPYRAFVVTETHGKWGNAKEVPGMAALGGSRDAQVMSVSCASAGDCSAGGFYAINPHHGAAFVVDEIEGTWRTAKEVPGMNTLNQGYAAVNSVSCASAGNCSAGGYYETGSGSGPYPAFVVNETKGKWGKAIEVPGIAKLNKDGYAGVNSLSCPSAAKCGAGGWYEDGSGRIQPFVISRS